ncbi:MAG TPA: hypothetical protein VHA75_17755 [Rugosimonospora sp.]|nr:hypothetical protein [Rugosimonospora sp.]
MLPPEDQTLVREWLAEIAVRQDECRAEMDRLAQLRCDILRLLRDRGRLSNVQLGALAGTSAARAGELARAGNPERFAA